MLSHESLSFRYLTAAAGLLVFSAMMWGSPQKDSPNTQPTEEVSLKQAIAALQSQIDRQEKQIEALMQTVAAQQQVLASIHRQPGPAAPVQTATTSVEALAASIPVEALQQPQKSAIDDLKQKVDSAIGNLGGFKFSGDFRFRADMQARSSNAVAGPLQNIR